MVIVAESSLVPVDKSFGIGCADVAVVRSKNEVMSNLAASTEDDLLDLLSVVPAALRRYFVPMVALAVHLHRTGVDQGVAFKVASKASRKLCRCCLLQNKKGCCTGRSQLERASAHNCTYCVRWLLMGFGSAWSLPQALKLASSEEVRKLLERHAELAASASVVLFEGAIPKIMHQIWIGPRPVPSDWIDTWRVQHATAHPDWQHRLWREEDIMAILPAELQGAFESLPQWCLKADIARYVILARHGGVYLDADLCWLGQHSLGSVTSSRTVVMALEHSAEIGYGSDERIGNCVLGTPAGHPVILKILDDIATDFAALSTFLGPDSPFMTEFKIGHRLTGPAAVSYAYRSCGLAFSELVAPWYFHPLPWWRGQSLSVTLLETYKQFPGAIATHYGYSTNRLGDEKSSATCASYPASVISQTSAPKTQMAKFLQASMDDKRILKWHADIGTARLAQTAAQEAFRKNMSSTAQEAHNSLSRRSLLSFDTATHDLQSVLMKVLDCSGWSLAKWHEQIPEFSRHDSASVLQHKFRLLAPLKDECRRVPFVQAYHNFVCDVIAPSVAATLAERGFAVHEIHYAAFPCLRVVPPSVNWNIRPHLDHMYQHPTGSLNVWLPLVDVEVSNTLWAESSPGCEDFTPFDLRYGEVYRWDGAQCIHFTMPNISSQTRVSLDFRLVPSLLFDETHVKGAYQPGDYYALCELAADGRWRCSNEGCVSQQHGFPFSMTKMKYTNLGISSAESDIVVES